MDDKLSQEEWEKLLDDMAEADIGQSREGRKIRQGIPPSSRSPQKVPVDWPVQPLKPGQTASDRAICGECGRSWDDGVVTSMTPAPAGRCPFEDFH